MSTEERLRQLQMADLGTSRREYISTVDEPRKQQSQVQLKVLEATRQSNIAGTAAARQAKEDAPRLAQWANLHKTIGDTQGLEDLDDLMSGQSHRANLNATIQAAGGQRYPSGPAKDHTSAKGHHPIPASSSGRGGGVIGTRGRGNSNTSPKAVRPERRAVTQRFDNPPLSHLDPALDVNNPGGPQRGRGGPRGHGKRRREEPLPPARPPPARGKKDVPPVRVKRPMIDFSRNLSTPEAFLAVARQTFRTETAAPSSPSPANPMPSAAVGQRLEQPNPFAHTKPKILIPPGLGPSPTQNVTDTPVSSRPAPKAAASPKPGATSTPVNRRPVSAAPASSTPGATSTPVSGRPIAKATAPSTLGRSRPIATATVPSTPQVTNTLVSTHPASKAPVTPTPPARVPHVYETATARSSPTPVSQRIPAEARTREAGAVSVRATAPNPAIEPQVEAGSTPGTNLQKPSDDANKKSPANLLLDVDAPAEVSHADLQKQIMSPGCAELTGIDFPSANKPRPVSPPSTPLAQGIRQTPPVNLKSELHRSARQLVQSSRLAQVLVDITHGTSDNLYENTINALIPGSGQDQELAAEHASTPRPSNTGRSLVEDWLSRTPADQIPSLNRTAVGLAKSSFEMYRSPAHTASSSGSAQKQSPDSLTPGLSPRKIAASEGIFGLENLKLSDEVPKASDKASLRSVIQKRGAEAVAQSIHASPSLGHYNPERAKGFEPGLSHSFNPFDPRSQLLRPAPAVTTAQQNEGSESATRRGPAPAFPPGLTPFAPTYQTAPVEVRQSTRPKIIGPPAYQPKPTGVKVIGPPPYQPRPTGPKIIGPPPFMPNYPVARPSTDTAQPDTPSLGTFEGATTTEPLSPGSSNVRKESTASPSTGSKYRPSPLSQYLSESIWASDPPKVTPDTSRQPEAQTSVHASPTENRPPPKVRVIGPQPYIAKDFFRASQGTRPRP